MIPAFQVNIGHKILKDYVAFGKFEDDCPSMAVATNGGKILLHSPHIGGSDMMEGTGGELPNVRFLNFNKKITSLASGNLHSEKDKSLHNHLFPPQNSGDDSGLGMGGAGSRDSLFVGTQSTVLAYDVQRNADLFFRDVPDGVNSLVAGHLGNRGNPMVFAGGNCSVLGYNKDGAESFWTVTGDNVTALAICDVNSDGLNELIVGSEDYEIRVFENEELISEQTEADRITHLSALDKTIFCYGLANGTIGVYSGPKSRLWRVKTKHQVHAVETYDLNADGFPEVISGWSNGVMNVRNISNGETMYKHQMTAPISSIVCGDYRNDGKEELIVCLENGEIRGFLPADFELLPTDLDGGGYGGSPKGKRTEMTGDQKVLSDLQKQKQDLQQELHSYEKSLKSLLSKEAVPGVLPDKTHMVFSLMADPSKEAVLLNVEVSSDVLITNVVVIDLEGVVMEGGEIITITPSKPTKEAIIPIQPLRHSACTLRVQSHVSVRGFTSNLYVFEEMVDIPRFSSFAQLTEASHVNAPTSHVSLTVHEDLPRIISWIQSSFIVFSNLKIYQDKIRAHFAGVKPHPDHVDNKKGYQGIPLFIFANREDGGTVTSLQIRCDDMELTADVVQDLTSYFNIKELESTVNFPKEMSKFEAVLKDVAEYNALRVKMSADMADDSQRVKALIVRAEDARIMTDMETMSRAYTDLYSLNNQCIAGYNNRMQSHTGLLNALKEVNQMIQKAANLRMGTAKTRVITDCRVAVKANNMQSLFKIIKQGYDNNPGKK